ncbi:MAG: diaminopimelate epimerase [Candidatus Eremiobacteraeota bacterium]|nr:diaminopimelate epimerase [Candidatus Eremiobacteraeota bacterium]
MNALQALHVVKMHGAENTFVVLDERPPRFERYDDLARTLCDPGGVLEGADGVLVVRNADGFAAEMQIYNADGSRAEMCGNGIRCVARYLVERGAPEKMTIATLAGPIVATVVGREPYEVRVDMGPVTFANHGRPESLELENGTWTFYDVSVGNPHAVIFVDDVAAIDLVRLGAAFNRHARFESGTNVHVVQCLDATSLRVRHYERGAGLTQACGTGAVACVATAIAVRNAHAPVAVHVPGGVLSVAWAASERAFLTGPAETMFERTISL